MADRDVTLKLRLKPPSASELANAFSGVENAAKKAGTTGGKSLDSSLKLPDLNYDNKKLPPLGLPKAPPGPGTGKMLGQVGGAMSGAGMGGIGGALSGIGGVVGAAGPVGMAIAAGAAAMKVASFVGAIPGKLVASGLSLVAGAMRGLQSQLGPIQVAFDLAGAGAKAFKLGLTGAGLATLGPLGGALGYGLGAGIEAIIGPAKEATEAMFGLAKAASPATGKRFDLAVADQAAVMGRIFIPVLEHATAGVRLFGDVLASVLPSSAEVRTAFLPLQDALSEVRDAAADVAPFIKATLLAGLQLLGAEIKRFASNVKGAWAFIRQLTGLPKNAQGLASSQGASSSTASFSSIEEFSRQNQLRAYGAGAENVMTPTENYLKEIRDFVRNILDKFGAGDAPNLSSAAGKVTSSLGNTLIRDAVRLGQTIYDGLG